jgi:hypothetical protein
MKRTIQAAFTGIFLLSTLAVAAAVPELPPQTGFLFWTPAQQRIGYRNIEKIFPTRTVKRGAKVAALPNDPAKLAVSYQFQGSEWNTEKFIQANRVAGLLVIQHGKVMLERYGLGQSAHDRWTSFSVGKSAQPSRTEPSRDWMPPLSTTFRRSRAALTMASACGSC